MITRTHSRGRCFEKIDLVQRVDMQASLLLLVATLLYAVAAKSKADDKLRCQGQQPV